jgi:hypothetical protein
MWITIIVVTNVSWLCVVIGLAYMLKQLNTSHSALLTQTTELQRKAAAYDKIVKDGLAGKHLSLHQKNGALEAELNKLKTGEPDKADRLIIKLADIELTRKRGF